MPKFDFSVPVNVCDRCGNKPIYIEHVSGLWWEVKCQCGQSVKGFYAYNCGRVWNKRNAQ